LRGHQVNKETLVYSLNDKVVLITGAKGGLGTFVTQAFLDAGATVVGASRSIAAADFPHSSFFAMPAELSSAESTEKLSSEVVDRFQKIDALVHLVGGFAGGKSVAETDDATLARMFELNFRSAFHIVKAVIPQMRRQRAGRILAVGSRAAVEPGPMTGAYNASKAALVTLIRTIASENQDVCISANVVLPGTMDTPANRAANPQADFSKWVQPSQVAAMLVHLASDAAAQVNGAVIPLYGRDV
jgi:NAD(P)-dependent dehydrogenase (short-subunit alcohol dehydrogenase family)